MNIKILNNKLKINEKELSFSSRIEKLILFNDFCVIWLMEDNIPDDNIIGVNFDGTIRWRISDIIKLTYSEAYVSLSKESDSEISVISYNGIKTLIDVYKEQIINKQITK